MRDVDERVSYLEAKMEDVSTAILRLEAAIAALDQKMDRRFDALDDRSERRFLWLLGGQLTTLLPDKYPGQTIVFSALVASVDPSVTISYGKRWAVSIAAGYFRTFSYKRSSQFGRQTVRGGVSIEYRR